jgi:hypothetical protein
MPFSEQVDTEEFNRSYPVNFSRHGVCTGLPTRKAGAMGDPENENPTDDAESDPALDDGENVDWSSEGGATTSGPATDTDNSD